MKQDQIEDAPTRAALSSAPLAGIALIVFACLMFSLLDSTAKYLSSSVPVLQIVWVRYLSHTILLCGYYQVWKNRSLLKTNRPYLQTARSLCLLGCTGLNFFAVQYLQLAELMAILFAAPLVITAMAGPLLGEWAGPRRWLAILVGFVGVLIVTQPGMGNMHWAAFYVLASVVLYAFYSILTRKSAGSDGAIPMLINTGLVGVIVTTPFGVSDWVTPNDAFTWGLLLMTGVLGCGGHLVFILAHKLAPASLLAPFLYIQIIWMIVLGYLIFTDVPGSHTLIGAAIVVASGLYILYREQQKGSKT